MTVEALPAKSLRDEVELHRLHPARRRLDVVDAGEVALQGREQFALGAALEDLGDEMTARLQYLKREIGGDLAEVNRAEMVGLAMAGGRRGHVGEDDVGRLAGERVADRLRRLVGEEILLEHDDAGKRIHVEIVDRDDARVGVGRAHPAGGDLGPAAGGRAEVDDPLARGEQAEAVVDLDQLVGGAGAVAFGAGAGDIGVVELALEPAGRRRPSGAWRS